MKSGKHPVVLKILIIATFLISAYGMTFIRPDGDLAAKTQDAYKHLETFSNVLNLIQQNYVEEVDPEKALEGAIKGMLNTLDPHSSYMKPDDFKELQVETKGSFSGIGIEITVKDNVLTVVSPIEGTPAFKQGIKAGDKIIKIDDELTKDLTLIEAVKKLRGAQGSEVTISIHREGMNELKDITIVRDVIPLQSVKSRFIEPGYSYIRIINFQSMTTKDFKKALSDLSEEQEIKGLILDLRNNPGGLLDQAVKIADLFIEEGVIVSTKGRIKDQNMVFEAHGGDEDYRFPMVILVNEGSASASEIVAGALQDHRRAMVIGAQTFGKGSVQTIIPMEDGAGLRLTTARYYTPNGTSIQATGIVPDIAVPTGIADETPADHSDKDAKKPRFLREKDLKHHISNGNGQDDTREDKEKKEEDRKDKQPENDQDKDNDKDDKDDKDGKDGKDDGAAAPDGDDKKPAGPESLERDPQLYTALTLLKGINVYEENKAAPAPTKP